MTYSGAYAVVLVLHLLAVAFLLGPPAVAAVMSTRYLRQGRTEALREAARTTRAFTQASVLVLVLGAALVGISGGDSGTPEWSMGSLWVVLSLVLSLVAVALVLGLVVPAQESAADDLESGADAGAPAGRIGAGAGIAMLCWFVVVGLMVFKPGA